MHHDQTDETKNVKIIEIQTHHIPSSSWTTGHLDYWTTHVHRHMKRLLSQCAIAMYSFAGLGIGIRGRKARRAEAPVLVVSPHSSFLDAVIIFLTGMTSPLVRDADANLGSKCLCEQ